MMQLITQSTGNFEDTMAGYLKQMALVESYFSPIATMFLQTRDGHYNKKSGIYKTSLSMDSRIITLRVTILRARCRQRKSI